MKPQFALHFCLCWAEYFMFVLGLPMQTADPHKRFQNKPWVIQPLLGWMDWTETGSASHAMKLGICKRAYHPSTRFIPPLRLTIPVSVMFCPCHWMQAYNDAYKEVSDHMLKNVPGVLAFFQSNDVNNKRWDGGPNCWLKLYHKRY